MIGTTEVSVFLPDEYQDKLDALCKELGWTHGALLTDLIDSAPPAKGQKEPPPPKTKRSDSPRRFTATLDSFQYKRLNTICEVWSWSHRDAIIHLLDHYMKETHNDK